MSIKQVIVIRKDLNMRKGKMVAQGAHASLGAIISLGRVEYPPTGEYDCFSIPLSWPELRYWLEQEFTKVCVGCDSEEEIVALENKAKELGIHTYMITDSGKTEFNGIPTKTALAIGPDSGEMIDEVTGHLSLL